MIYRNVYFKKNIIQNGLGDVDVYYTGHIYSNCESIKDFRSMFDRQQDLLVPCSECAAQKYRRFIKTNKF